MNDQEQYSQMVSEFKRAGWVMGVLAAGGMLARLVFTNEKFVMLVWGRKIFAASFIGIVVYFAMYESGVSEIYKSVICSVSGSFAPELFEFVRNKVLSRLSNE